METKISSNGQYDALLVYRGVFGLAELVYKSEDPEWFNTVEKGYEHKRHSFGSERSLEVRALVKSKILGKEYDELPRNLGRVLDPHSFERKKILAEDKYLWKN